MKRLFKGCEIKITGHMGYYKVILNWLSHGKQSELYFDYESNSYLEAVNVAKEYISNSIK